MFVIDTTVLSNFAAVQKIDTLVRILKAEAVVPEPVVMSFMIAEGFRD